MSFLPFCWLVPHDPGPFPEPFSRTFDDYDKFKLWFNILTSIQDPENSEALKHIILTYKTIVNSSKEIFSINCVYAKQKCELHQRIRAEILPIIYDLREDYELSKAYSDKDEMIENVFARILIYAHLSGIEFREDFVKLIIPIFHVYYYGILQSQQIEFRLEIIEALVADSFVRFMTGPIFNHIKVFDPSYMESLLKQFISLIKSEHSYKVMTINQITPNSFALGWIRTIFMTEINFGEVIKIWDFLFTRMHQFTKSKKTENNGIHQFHLDILFLCAGCVRARENECTRVKPYQTLETLQDLDDVKADQIVF